MKRSVAALLVLLATAMTPTHAEASEWESGVAMLRLGGGSYGFAVELGAVGLHRGAFYLDVLRFGVQAGAPYDGHDHGTYCKGNPVAAYVGPALGHVWRLDGSGRHRLALGALVGYGSVTGPRFGSLNYCEHGEFSGLVLVPELAYQFAWSLDGAAVELGVSSVVATGAGWKDGYPAPSFLAFVGLRDL